MPGSTPKPRRKSASPAARPRGATGPALTHFDAGGRAHMVDVGDKDVTHRVARARGSISMSPATFERIREGGVAKGDVLGIARIAAIGAAKRTSDLIPLCHPLPLTRVAVDFALDEAGVAVRIEVVAETRARTGVEMEALTAAAVGLLTVYDMCKAADRGMRIGALELVEKSGGKSGPWRADRT